MPCESYSTTKNLRALTVPLSYSQYLFYKGISCRYISYIYVICLYKINTVYNSTTAQLGRDFWKQSRCPFHSSACEFSVCYIWVQMLFLVVFTTNTWAALAPVLLPKYTRTRILKRVSVAARAAAKYALRARLHTNRRRFCSARRPYAAITAATEKMPRSKSAT